MVYVSSFRAPFHAQNMGPHCDTSWIYQAVLSLRCSLYKARPWPSEDSALELYSPLGDFALFASCCTWGMFVRGAKRRGSAALSAAGGRRLHMAAVELAEIQSNALATQQKA